MSGLINRLEQVIKNYEDASNLVKNYKEGKISEDALGKGFQTLRARRKAVHQHNRNYLKEQKRIYLGTDDDDDDSEEEQEEEEDEDEDLEEDECESEEDAGRAKADGSGHGEHEDASRMTSKRTSKEEKLWKEYGAFWKEL